jgi:hypothetical protein
MPPAIKQAKVPTDLKCATAEAEQLRAISNGL